MGKRWNGGEKLGMNEPKRGSKRRDKKKNGMGLEEFRSCWRGGASHTLKNVREEHP